MWASPSRVLMPTVADVMVADAIVGDASQGTVVGRVVAAPDLLNGPCCSTRIKVVPIEAK